MNESIGTDFVVLSFTVVDYEMQIQYKFVLKKQLILRNKTILHDC